MRLRYLVQNSVKTADTLHGLQHLHHALGYSVHRAPFIERPIPAQEGSSPCCKDQVPEQDWRAQRLHRARPVPALRPPPCHLLVNPERVRMRIRTPPGLPQGSTFRTAQAQNRRGRTTQAQNREVAQRRTPLWERLPGRAGAKPPNRGAQAQNREVVGRRRRVASAHAPAE